LILRFSKVGWAEHSEAQQAGFEKIGKEEVHAMSGSSG
jgi:hypothetical protein